MKRFLPLFFMFLSLQMRGETVTGDAGTSIKWSYDTDTGVLTLNGSGEMSKWNTNAQVPWYSYKSGIKKVVIGEGITNIGSYAFHSYENLTDISIPSTVTTLNSLAIFNNENLEHVALPEGLLVIGNNNFSNCRRLKNLHIPASTTLESSPFFGCDSLRLTVSEENSLYTADDNALYDKQKTYLIWGCKQITSFTIPETVANINSLAFRKGRLTELNIPETVKTIGYDAFAECKELVSVTISADMLELNSSAFAKCQNLKRAEIRGKLTPIQTASTEVLQYTFDGCSLLEKVVLPDSLTGTMTYTFRGCEKLDNVSIPAGTTTLNSVFYQCKNLKNIILPEGVKSLEHTFDGCTSLKNIVLPEGITSMRYTFDGCTSLETVVLPDSLTGTMEYTFRRCEKLDNVSIPAGTTTLNSVFYQCKNLKNVILPEGVKSLEYTFNGCTSLETVNIPSTTTDIRMAFQQCKRLKSINLGIWIEDMQGAFIGCDSLADVTVAHSIPVALTTASFSDKAIQNALLHVPYGTTSVYSNTEYWQFANILEDHEPVSERASGRLGAVNWSISEDWKMTIKASETYRPIGEMTSYHTDTAKESTSDNGANDDIANASQYPWYPYRDKIKEIYVDKDVKKLGWSCFYGMTSLEKITLPFFGLSETAEGSESGFGAIFGRNKPKMESKKTSTTMYDYYYTYTFNIPSQLKNIVFTGETADNTVFQRKYSFSGNISRYQSIREYRTEYYDMPDTFEVEIDFLNVKTLIEGFRIYPAGVTIRLNYTGEGLTEGALAGAAGLRYLKIPGTGAANGSTTYPFYSLFGSEKIEGMTYVNGKYMPSNLEEIVVTDAKQIPEAAFKDLTMVQKITLPSTVVSVGNSAFYGCSGLTDLYVNSAFPPIAYSESFTGVSKYYCKLHVPIDSKDFYKNDEYWKYFYFIESDANVRMTVKKNIEYAGEVTGINQYNNGETVSFFAAPNAGYRFVEWKNEHGEVLSADNQLSFTATCDSTLIAVFAPINNFGKVQTTVTEQTVKLTWNEEEGATYYTVEIYSDAAMTNLVRSIIVNADGTISSQDNYSRSVADQTTINTVIDQLAEESRFFYLITAYSADDTILAQGSGYFSTQATGISNIVEEKDIVITVSGNVLSVCGSIYPVFIYSSDGRFVRNDNANTMHKITLPSGLYIIHTGRMTKKVYVK